ncbi:MAG TPA: aconitate hydratase AcnA [Thermoplasmata archaeon]|nr:aconitate hydratase AcnA [Thermoplasmata archaeon]
MTRSDPLGAADRLALGNDAVTIFRPERLAGVDPVRFSRRPRTVRVILENVVRHFDPAHGDAAAIVALANGQSIPEGTEFAYYPERVLLQDFTGVPVIVDLSILRSAAVTRGLPAERVNPSIPVDLIVDHSVQVDSFGSPRSLMINLDREYERNHERYRFLRWAKGAYRHLRIVPPGNGICHQVNLEYLATVVTRRDGDGGPVAFPDTLIGTDSHTTMVNGVSVLGWGVGGIEAEAVMLGEPYFLPRPVVVGVELTGVLPEGATATDLVLTVTRRLREQGVVDQFVEFFGPGVAHLSVPDRATISNMCPEYGATAAYFPIDAATLAYLAATGRDPAQIARVEAYARAQGLWGSPAPGAIDYDSTLSIDLGRVVPTVAGPRNPDESVALGDAPLSFQKAVAAYRAGHPAKAATAPPVAPAIDDGAVVIAAITSCTNTSNPSVMVGAGLIAQRALALGLSVPPHVKTSLAPGSKVVTAYLERAGLLDPLAQLGFAVVGFGCTTCIGNSGPLIPAVSQQVRDRDLVVAAVLSGNRNFDARINNDTRTAYLASPMLVVAYALAGRMDVDLTHQPLGKGRDGRPIYLKDLWPSPGEIQGIVAKSLDPSMYTEKYRAIEVGDVHWESLDVPSGANYPWDPASTYLAEAPYLSLPPPWRPVDGRLVAGARALVVLGDRVSTDHISPAGEIPESSPAGQWLIARGVPPAEFNTYGTRRGHHEVMVRGTFGNVRLKNELAVPREGGVTVHLPDGAPASIFEAAQRYARDGVPLIVLAGKGYGQGSSRDWAAKGPRLLGVGAVICETFERIHRSNLVEMGVLPLTFPAGRGWKALGLTGREAFELRVPGGALAPRGEVEVEARRDDGSAVRFVARCEIHSTTELGYYRAGGVLPYVMEHRFATGRSP